MHGRASIRIGLGDPLRDIAKGDSSTRVIGERQATMAEFKNGVRLIQRLMNGETVEYKPKTPDKAKWLAQAGGKPIKTHFHWYKSPGKIPTYIGGYGPKTLEFAGEAADAVVVQAPHRSAVEWSLGHAYAGAKKVDRDPKSLRVVVSGPIAVSDDARKACDDLRWFVQAVWNHTAHLLEHYKRSELPEALVTGFPDDFRSDYSEHIQREADELKQVPDRAVDLLTVFGSADRCLERLRDLSAIGVKEFIHYAVGALPKAEIDEQLTTLGKQIIPRMS
jgi:alkanesulfonate monooxygenase SsuD/methylene tetrahydromethanopterin reductase-like flavin-dependent oxidoreductase (luciferase family)